MHCRRSGSLQYVEGSDGASCVCTCRYACTHCGTVRTVYGLPWEWIRRIMMFEGGKCGGVLSM